MKTLEQLFDSRARVRIMRLFLLNPHLSFENADISRRTKETAPTVRKELNLLSKAGFVKKTSFFKEMKVKNSKNKPRKKRVVGWTLNTDFPFLPPLQQLIVNSTSFDREDMVKRLRKAGNLKLLVLSGIFIREDESKLDILIVGDRLRKKALETALKDFEAEIGKELTYAFLETHDFKYRIGMYDKFVRDILDYPHERVLDKIGLHMYPGR